ncbi:MAG: DUF3644 domain-containing protein [Pseudomonadota bacterium]
MKGLPLEVKALLTKAHESAILAVETYNRPSASFRSGAYIVLMVIAWTSLFHAIFLHKNIRPYHRKPNSKRFEKIDGDYKRWELAECIRQYFKTDNPAIRRNLEFFVGLRNKIEHRSMPALDPGIFGECQAMLLNFEDMICSEFGDRYAINGGLSLALQSSKLSAKQKPPAGKTQEAKTFSLVKSYVDQFRSSLSTEIYSDLAYSFKVYLVPKVSVHNSKDTVAVEWVKYDPAKHDEMKQYERVVALIKPKEVRVANLDLLKPSEVAKKVAVKIGKPFNVGHHHVICYRHFNARPMNGAPDPKACDTRYCVYDTAHRDYLYTQEWVDHLVRSLADKATYDFLFTKKLITSSMRPTETVGKV